MKVRISAAQINPLSGDIEGNARKILGALERARQEQCDVVVCPEMCLTGYCLDEKLLINRRFLRTNKQVLLEKIAPAAREVAAVVGFVDFDEDRTGPDGRPVRYNAAAVLHGGQAVQIVHKRLLPAYRYFDDKRYFRPGTQVEPVRLELSQGPLSIGVLICEDLWDEGYDLKPAARLAEGGAECLFVINASPFCASSPGARDGKRFRRQHLLRRQARRCHLPIVYVNTVGVGDNGKNVIPFDGQSMAYDREGNLVAALSQFREEQQTICLERGRGQPIADPPFDREAEIYEALVMGVRDYFDKVGVFDCVLQSVSGGIDSALGTAIAFEAVGQHRLLAYNLPSRFNSEQTRDAARKLAGKFGLDYHVIPIQPIVDRVVSDIEKHLHPIRNAITVENLQARIRGLIMMAESNDRRALLLTNGNETEIALGYATLYGDMVGGLSVIGDLPKPDVYRLARHVNRRWDREMIPEEIFRIQPSAELAEDQVDPFDYEVVGPVVSDFIERGLSPGDLVRAFKARELAGGRYPGEGLYESYDAQRFEQLARKLFAQLNASVYKRLQGAPIIVVSERAFGFDLRETIINGWKG